MRNKRVVTVQRTGKEMFADYIISANNIDKTGREVSIAKLVELTKDKNIILSVDYSDFNDSDQCVKDIYRRQKIYELDYLRPYKNDSETFWFLAEHSETLTVRIFPDNYNWETMVTECRRSNGLFNVILNCYGCRFSDTKFLITPELKDFGEDYLRQLKECGNRIKYY